MNTDECKKERDSMYKDSELMKKARGAALELAEYVLKNRFADKLPVNTSVEEITKYGAYLFLMGILVDRRTSKKVEEFKRSISSKEQLTDYYIEPLNDR